MKAGYRQRARHGFFSVILAGALGCGTAHTDGAAASGGSAGTTASGGSASGSGGAGPGAGGTAGSGPAATFLDACRESCAIQAGCGFTTLATCQQGCANLDGAYSADCKAAALPELLCESSLSCAELTAFADDYRGHALCGATYSAFAAACGHAATPPVECQSFCDTAEGCEPESVVGGCADNCNILAGSYTAVYGPSCTTAGLDLFACYGNLSCAEMSALLLTQTAPASCNAEALASAAACQ